MNNESKTVLFTFQIISQANVSNMNSTPLTELHGLQTGENSKGGILCPY
jgi:hypothetical protein